MSLTAIRHWRDMDRWTPRASVTWTTTFPRQPLGDVLILRQEPVSPEEFSHHAAITIRFDGSMELRQRGEPFNGSMFAAQPGDVVFSKIDVRNGAIALVPENFGKVVVTSEYPIHRPDSHRLDARYFAMLLRTPNFMALLQDAASGTSGRKRVNAESFEEIEIPLPETEAQRALVEAYEAGLRAAAVAEQEATEVERRGLQQFESALGLTPPPDLPRRLLQIARFRDIDRWSHEGVLYRRVVAARGASAERFPLVALGDVVADLENGWSPQCLSLPAGPEQWGVLKLGAVSFGEYDESENKALPSHLQPIAELEIQQGDVLISRANIPRLVGACAHVHATRPQLMLCDKIFRVVFLKSSGVLPEFLAEILKAPSVRQQIESSATGTSPTMRNISKPALLELTFPLPQGIDGIEIQKRLIANLAQSRADAARRREEAKKLRTFAWDSFLGAVFS